MAVKLQLARFEVLGPAGRAVLDAVAAHATGAGLLVIADGKRGRHRRDRGRLRERAARAALQTPFGALAGLGADLAHRQPADGRRRDRAVRGRRASDRGGGAAAGAHLQPRCAPTSRTSRSRAAGRVWERVAELVERLGAAGVGESGLSDVGAVLGATEPQHLARARELMPHAPFLLPGVGAQGGRVEDLAPAFAPGRAGGLVSASRSIAGAHRARGGAPRMRPEPRPSACARPPGS